MVDKQLKRIDRRMKKTNKILLSTIRDDMKQDTQIMRLLRKEKKLERENRILKVKLRRRSK